MSSVDPDYVSGGGGGVGGGVDPDYVSGGGGEVGGVEKKVLAVFEREFAVAIQQVEMIKDMIAIQDGKRIFSLNLEFAISMDVTKQMIVLRLNFIFLCLYQKEEELATIDERIFEVRRSVIMNKSRDA